MWYIDTADWTAMVKLMKQRILIKYLQRLGFIPVMGDPFSWNDAMYDILIFIIDHTVAGILIVNTHILVSNDNGCLLYTSSDTRNWYVHGTSTPSLSLWHTWIYFSYDIACSIDIGIH